jgi:hypothetical protein
LIEGDWEDLLKYGGDNLYTWKDIDENSGSNVISREMAEYGRIMPVNTFHGF